MDVELSMAKFMKNPNRNPTLKPINNLSYLSIFHKKSKTFFLYILYNSTNLSFLNLNFETLHNSCLFIEMLIFIKLVKLKIVFLCHH